MVHLDMPVCGPSLEIPQPHSVFDHAEALARVEGDAELFAELVELFLDSYPEQLSAIRIGVHHRDAKAVQSAAHALKGAVGNFAGEEAFELARKLESIGRSGDLSMAESTSKALSAAVERLAQALTFAIRESVDIN
jgi:HPt (histidine-containing phosphotransfer) domain-containing protein